MALNVTRDTIKKKCRISVSDFDSEIDALISEQLPVIEFAILQEHIDDTGNSGLQATLNLGAAEVIAGEFLAQAHREPGASESLYFVEVSFGTRPPHGFEATIADPFGLKEQGWKRLAPYLKPQVRSHLATDTLIRSKTSKLDEEGIAKW